MKLFFKVAIIFLIVFNFRLPIVYNTVFLAILLMAVYYNYTKGYIPLTYFRQHYIVVILIATLLLAFVFFSFTVFHNEYFFENMKRVFVELLMLGALVFTLPLLLDEGKSDAFEVACKYIAYAFAFQGLIVLSGLLLPSWGDYLISIKPGVREELAQRYLAPFRGYAMTGSLFFELPSAFGVAFIAFMRLQLIKGQRYISGWMSYAVFSLILIGIMCSGRVGFIGIAVGLVLYFIFVPDPFVIVSRSFSRMLIFIPAVLLVYFVVLKPSQRAVIEEDVFHYAFEAYYTYQETGRFSTRSSDVTVEKFYFPLEDNTLAVGHGKEAKYYEEYPFTDAGYMRTLIFGGIPLLLILLIYQFIYFQKPLSIARNYKTRESKIDTAFFLFLFIYILILHYKDNALGIQHISETMFLYLGITYILRHQDRLKNSREE